MPDLDVVLPSDNLDPNARLETCPEWCPVHLWNFGTFGMRWCCEHRAAVIRPHAVPA